MSFPLLKLSKWLQLEIFKRVLPDDFLSLKVTNKKIWTLTSGKLTDKQKLFYGDQITESLYKDRSERFLADALDHKDESVSWRQFYFRVIKFKKLSNKKGFHNIQSYYSDILANKGKLLELKLFSTFNVIIFVTTFILIINKCKIYTSKSTQFKLFFKFKLT